MELITINSNNTWVCSISNDLYIIIALSSSPCISSYKYSIISTRKYSRTIANIGFKISCLSNSTTSTRPDINLPFTTRILTCIITNMHTISSRIVISSSSSHRYSISPTTTLSCCCISYNDRIGLKI